MQCSWIYPLQAKLTDLLTCSPFHVLNLCTQREETIWKGCTWQDNSKRRIWELVKSHQWLGTPVALLVPSPDDDEQILMHWFLWLLISSFAYFHIGFAFLCTTVNIQVQPQEPKWNTNWIFITLKNICGWHKSFISSWHSRCWIFGYGWCKRLQTSTCSTPCIVCIKFG